MHKRINMYSLKSQHLYYYMPKGCGTMIEFVKFSLQQDPTEQ
jgi:hypothetical protein